MSSLLLHRALTYSCSQRLYCLFAAQRTASIRGYSTTRDKRENSPRERENSPKERGDIDDMFSPDNLKDLSPVEVARMRVTYGLVKEHVEALEKGLPGIDPERNPLIDPRSFDVRKLPRLPDEVLEHFRDEVPADVAAVSKPVVTHGLWEAIRSGEGHDLIEETSPSAEARWNAVDERTMDSRTLSRMRRQAAGTTAAQQQITRPQQAMTVGPPQRRRKKRACPLKNERGRVMVDYRATGTLGAFLSDDLKLLPRRKSGLCAKSQRKLSKAVKTARSMALLNPEPKPHLTVEEMLEIDRNLP